MDARKSNKQPGFLHFIICSFWVILWFIFDELLSNRSKTFLLFKIGLEEVQEYKTNKKINLFSLPKASCHCYFGIFGQVYFYLRLGFSLFIFIFVYLARYCYACNFLSLLFTVMHVLLCYYRLTLNGPIISHYVDLGYFYFFTILNNSPDHFLCVSFGQLPGLEIIRSNDTNFLKRLFICIM